MTVITKTVIKPKNDKIQSPLVDDKCTVSVDIKSVDSDDIDTLKPTFYKVCGIPVRNLIYMTSVLVLLSYAVYLYSAIMETANNEVSARNFKGWAEIPMPQHQEMDVMKDDFERIDDRLNDILSQLFKEFVEIDVLNESEAIDVPDFNGIKGRFIHDFQNNFSAIIDPVKNRCFVMPLNRSAILPPKSLLDAITKIEQGYYEVDMSVVKQNYVAVFPPITNYRMVGTYIAKECGGIPTYRLEKINRDVFKRSVEDKKVSFTHYAGKTFQEITISNMAEVESYEQTN